MVESMHFEFASPSQILFGTGVASTVARHSLSMGSKPFLITGKNPQRYSAIFEQFHSLGVNITLFQIKSEPTVEAVTRATSMAKENHCDVVLAIGGGSVIDAAKAVAALMTNSGDIYEYLEVVGKGKQIENPPLPCIAVPTTAGSGAEVTRNAVLLSAEHKVKVSMRSTLMTPKIAIIDPLLTLSLSPSITAYTGIDTLTHLIESYVSNAANPITDLLCLEGLRRLSVFLLRVFRDGNDTEARQNMSFASLLGGLSLANSKLGAVHGIAAAVGGILNAPHGAICAGILPHIIEANINALRRVKNDSDIIERYRSIASILSGKPQASAKDCVASVLSLCSKLQIPKLSNFGLSEQMIPDIAAAAANASSTRGNPVILNNEELAVAIRKSIILL